MIRNSKSLQTTLAAALALLLAASPAQALATVGGMLPAIVDLAGAFDEARIRSRLAERVEEWGQLESSRAVRDASTSGRSRTASATASTSRHTIPARCGHARAIHSGP